MKLLTLFIALSLPGANMLQIMATAGSLAVLLKMAMNKFVALRSRWITERKYMQMQRNMWVIE